MTERFFDQVRVLRIEQPIQRFPVPIDGNAEARTECLEDAVERSRWDAITLSTFDAADRRLRGPGGVGEVSLAPAATPTKRANGASNPHEIHGRSLEVLDARPIAQLRTAHENCAAINERIRAAGPRALSSFRHEVTHRPGFLVIQPSGDQATRSGAHARRYRAQPDCAANLNW